MRCPHDLTHPQAAAAFKVRTLRCLPEIMHGLSKAWMQRWRKMNGPVGTPHTTNHCSAGPVICIECMAELAASVARLLGYSEHEAARVNDDYYGAILRSYDAVSVSALRGHVIGLCRANDLATVAVDTGILDITHSDFVPAESPLSAELLYFGWRQPRITGERIDAPAIAKHRWWHDSLVHPVRTLRLIAIIWLAYEVLKVYGFEAR